MTNTQKWTLGCLALAVIVLFGGGAVAFLMLVPDVEQQLPPGISSLVVTLSTPLNDAQVPLNQFTTVTAEALGVKPITALELWIDGVPSETKNAPAGSTLNQFAASWAWTPASEGEYTLLVRAIDADRNIGMSNIVRVTASKDANVVTSVGVQAKPGDTVASVAQQAKTSPQQIIDLNPQVSPSGTITPGQTITVPIPTPPPTPPPPTTPEPPPSPTPPPDPGQQLPPGSKYKFWLNKYIFDLFAPIKPPASPSLTASVGAGKCSIDLYIDDKSNNEDGFFLYRLDPNEFGFKHIATLDAHSGAPPIHYVDPVSTGKYQYYVASFNAAGESPSKIVKAAIIEPCGPPSQGLGLDKGKVTVKPPVDKIYCYLQVDGGPWTRIPPGANTFITPTKPGEFDVSQYLKSLTPSPPPAKMTLHLECWGWNGSTLIFLGEATETITPGPVQIIGNNFTLVGNLSAALPALNIIPHPSIARPTNAQITLDPKECLKHASPNPLVQFTFAILCQGAADNGYQFLVWDWSPNACSSGNCIQDTDGYHIYIQSVGNPPTLIDTVKDRQHKVSILPPKSAPMFPPYFFVRAFKGSSESEDSNQAQSKTTQAKMTLAAESTAWRYVYDHETGFSGCAYTKGLGPPSVGSGEILVGHSRWYDSGTVCWERLDQYYRGAIWFDVSKIKGQIVEARLQYRWASGEYSPDPETATNQKLSCATRLLLGAEDWRGKDYGDKPVTIPGEDYIALDGNLQMYYDGNTKTKEAYPFEVDVTSAVKQWKSGKPNYGFIFAGNDEWLFVEGNDWCYSRYTDFSLKVTYQPTGQ